jgi:hypothetical protein
MEEAIATALETALTSESVSQQLSGRTGADIFAALQACSYPDFMPEPAKIYMPVSDPVTFD